jgi:DNA-binding CsgD family transcriptional regulator
MNTYRLTTIEAELAMLICKGVPSNTIARSLGKKVGTVKTQRKSLFLKTRVSRSEQLVSLVFMLAADTDK